MQNSIVQIDISILDKEIETLKTELQKKTAMRDYISSLAKQFPATQTTKAPVKTQPPAKKAATPKQQPVNAVTKQQPSKEIPIQQPAKTPKQQPTKSATPKQPPTKAAAQQQPVKAAPKQQPAKAAPKPQTASTQPKGLTEFILDYLAKNPKSESKVVISSFAAATGKKPDAVKANIANTLSRLLKEKRLKKQEGEGLGYLWSLK